MGAMCARCISPYRISRRTLGHQRRPRSCLTLLIASITVTLVYLWSIPGSSPSSVRSVLQHQTVSDLSDNEKNLDVSEFSSEAQSLPHLTQTVAIHTGLQDMVEEYLYHANNTDEAEVDTVSVIHDFEPYLMMCQGQGDEHFIMMQDLC